MSSALGLSDEELLYQHQSILYSIRLPRALMAALIGAGMASCGAAMQGMFKNGLADPSLIGVAGGASLGASVAILMMSGALIQSTIDPEVIRSGSEHAVDSSILLLDKYIVAGMAFLGGLLATALVYRLGASSSGLSVSTMLLAGIAITSLAGAFSNLCTYLADDIALRRISIWRMGSMEGADWWDVMVCSTLIGMVLILMPRYGKVLNALLLGESEARHLGFDVSKVKKHLVALTALTMGVAVASAGVIGFVGLLVPHMVRLLIGPDHRGLLPCAALLGAILMVAADLGARSFLAPEELPVGVVTAALGAPFFIALLLKQRRLLNL